MQHRRPASAADPPPDAPLLKHLRGPAPPGPLALPQHRDIIAAILSHLPQAYRIRLASRVCKLWRRVVVANVLKLKLFASYPRAPTIALFPHLTSLSLPHRSCDPAVAMQPFRLPPALTSLSVCLPSLDRVILPPYPALTALALQFPELEFLELVARDARGRTSLQCLDVRSLDGKFISHLRLPSLTSLAVDAVLSEWVSGAVFIAAHSSQLRALTLRSEALTLLPRLNLPALRSLTCHTADLARLTQTLAHTVPAHYPALTELQISCNECSDQWAGESISLLAPLLTSLEPGVLSPSFCDSVLPHFTRLRRLSVPSDDTLPPPSVCAAVTQFSLLWAEPKTLWPFLQRCTNLRTIVATTAPHWQRVFAQRPEALTLPRVSRLSLLADLEEFRFSDLLVLIAAFKGIAPQLRKVSVLLVTTSDASDAEIVDLCIGCQAIGLERVWLTGRLCSERLRNEMRALPITVELID